MRFGLGLLGAWVGMTVGGLLGLYGGLAGGYAISGVIAWAIIMPFAREPDDTGIEAIAE
jgi:hypothetical protein